MKRGLFLPFLASALALAPAFSRSVDAFSVNVILSAAAAAKLQASREQIVVDVEYVGEPKNPQEVDEDGLLTIANQSVTIPAGGTASFGKLKLPDRELAKLVEEVRVNINVFTARKKFTTNLLHCGHFEKALSATLAAAAVRIECQLIGE